MQNSISQKNTLKNILKVGSSNILKLLAGVLVGFILPKIIGVEDYGYYKTFTLYAGYVGLFHFGFTDGIYLKYGGKDFSELDKATFRFYSRFLFLIEMIVSAILGIVVFLIDEGNFQFIFGCLVIYLFAFNITNYYQIISQVTGRFSELSMRNTIQSCLTALVIIILLIIYKANGILQSFKPFMMAYVGISVLLCLWYVFTYRSITFGSCSNGQNQKTECLNNIRLGFPLLFSNLCSTLLLSVDRQFVNVLFDTSAYAIYAFAYNMLALITTALAAISTVLYPNLKRVDEKTLKESYSYLINVILVVVFFCLIVYFPLCGFVTWFLPKYVESLPIFRVVLPGLAFTSPITIVMHNYYKALGENVKFFIISIVVLIVSCCANILAYSLFKTTLSISVASIVVMLVWYLISEGILVKKYSIQRKKSFIYILIMIVVFYLVSMINIWSVGLLVYVLIFSITTYFWFGKDMIRAVLSRLKT